MKIEQVLRAAILAGVVAMGGGAWSAPQAQADTASHIMLARSAHYPNPYVIETMVHGHKANCTSTGSGGVNIRRVGLNYDCDVTTVYPAAYPEGVFLLGHMYRDSKGLWTVTMAISDNDSTKPPPGYALRETPASLLDPYFFVGRARALAQSILRTNDRRCPAPYGADAQWNYCMRHLWARDHAMASLS